MVTIIKKIKSFFSSMRWTMMATYIVVIMVTLFLMSIYILNLLSENLYESKKTDLFTKANIVSETISQYVVGENHKAIEDYTNYILPQTGTRCIIVNTSYNVLFDTNKNSELKVLVRDIIKYAYEGEQADTILTDDLGINLMTVSVPITNKYNNEIVGAVYLVESMAVADKTISDIKVNMLVFSGLISILVGLLSFGMSYIVTSPVDEFTHAAEQISKGNFDTRVHVKGHNEFSQLAMTLNFMTSELGNLEENRKKFVSDASHELKTPLATIKLICDSIVSTPDPDPVMIQDFLGDLSDEVDRLTRIVERLLKLTKLDSGKSMPNLVPTDVVALISSITKKLTPNANKKNIVLYTDIKPDVNEPVIMDFDKIWEAIYNITDNAIKYTDEGGFVKIALEKDGRNILIQIEDNGPGIPQAEQERIFDRFYRLDDSRARDTGGTGLGLAIAKESVILHGGKIELSSEEGIGSTFSIYLPTDIEFDNT